MRGVKLLEIKENPFFVSKRPVTRGETGLAKGRGGWKLQQSLHMTVPKWMDPQANGNRDLLLEEDGEDERLRECLLRGGELVVVEVENGGGKDCGYDVRSTRVAERVIRYQSCSSEFAGYSDQ